MFAVEIYAAVRRFVFVEGKSRREAARVFGLSRDTIAKMCRYSAPPGYVRSKAPERPKLGPLVPVIDAILESDKTAPPKQRHTAKRIFERLRIEHGYAGGYTVVKDYVRIARSRSREVFVPLAHPPGHAQVDFGECIGVIGGVRMKLHVFCFDLPHSDACFIKAYPAETTEAFLDGHVSAFAFFSGVPLSILYDNLKIAVARILGDGKRQRTHAFTEDRSSIARRLYDIAHIAATGSPLCHRSSVVRGVRVNRMDRAFASHVHRKRPKGRPMPEAIRRANNAKSKIRSRVEHVFAEQKDRMDLFIRTIGIARATMKIGLANLVYNIKRLHFLRRVATA
jgi:transposase